MQDRQSVDEGDAVVAADISGGEHRGIARGGTVGCDCKRDRGVRGGDVIVAVQVAFLRRGSPRLREREAVHAATAARDRVWVVADAVAIWVGAGVVGVVVAFGAGVPCVGAVIVGFVVGVVTGVACEVVVVEGVAT